MSTNDNQQNMNQAQSDALCKIFVGNVNKQTTEEEFRAYFEKFGALREIVLMKDNTNPTLNRGFGFVTPETSDVTDRIVLQESHSLGGRDLDIKRALPKEINDPLLHVKTPRIFLGGLPHTATEEEITNFFNEKYSYMGAVKEVVIKKERQTGRPRGFCFVSFENPHVVDKILVELRYPVINNKRCEVKKADPGIPITGAPPSQISKGPQKPLRSGPGGQRPQHNSAPPPPPQNHQGYDYPPNYNSSQAHMSNYPQSNAYYSYFQNQAGMGSQYPNQPSYQPSPGSYGYPDQRGGSVRPPPYPRPNNNGAYTQGISNRARPY